MACYTDVRHLTGYYSADKLGQQLDASFCCDSGYNSVSHSRQASYEISSGMEAAGSCQAASTPSLRPAPSPTGVWSVQRRLAESPASVSQALRRRGLFDLHDVSAALSVSPHHAAPPLPPPRPARTVEAGRMSPSVYNYKQTAVVGVDRFSPVNDLGYHTLVSQCSDVTPPRSQQARGGRHALCSWTGPRPAAVSITHLPDSVLTHIMSMLSCDQLARSSRVCRRWHELAWQPHLWSCISLHSPASASHLHRALSSVLALLARGGQCGHVNSLVLNGCTRLADRTVKHVARRCPHIQHVEMRGCVSVSDSSVRCLLDQCGQLQHLDMTGCVRVTCHHTDDHVPSCHVSGVQHVDLTDCAALTDTGVQWLARSCPRLQRLFLRRCDHVTDVGVQYVASYCSELRELSVSDCVRVGDRSLHALARLGPSLRYLSVAKCTRVSDVGVRVLAASCAKLRYLNVRGCVAVRDGALAALAQHCRKLRALDVGKCDVSDAGVAILAQYCGEQLRRLSVKSCCAVSSAGVRAVALHCNHLQHLNIQDCDVNVDTCRAVKKYCRHCIIEHTNPGFF